MAVGSHMQFAFDIDLCLNDLSQGLGPTDKKKKKN